MTDSQRLKLLLHYKNMKFYELANLLGIRPQSLRSKINIDSFVVDDFKKIAEVTDSEFYYHFIFPDGTKI